MKAKSIILKDFIEKIIFKIPIYQRNYSWKEEEVEELLKDLTAISEKNLESYFIGIFIGIVEDLHTLSIIDGQQRLITISLILLAINDIERRDPRNSSFKEYLFYEEEENNLKHKIEPIKEDMKHFKKIYSILEKDEKRELLEEERNKSKIINNYLFIKRELLELKEKKKIDSLFSFFKTILKAVDLVVIELEKRENPQLIFESINATGLGLNEADKIKNFVLMSPQIIERQKFFYEEYWIEIEKNANEDLSNLIEYYLTIELGYTIAKRAIYKEFKKYIENSKNKNMENVLKKIKELSRLYFKIKNKDFKSKNAKKIILSLEGILEDLEYTISYPYILLLLSNNEEGVLSEDETLKILKTLESFLLRRLISSLPSSGLKSAFIPILKDLKDVKAGEFEKYYEKLLRALYKNNFPSDEVFLEKFREYKLNNKGKLSKNTKYILKNIEYSINTKETIIMDSEITIEHIMPQKLNSKWIEDLKKRGREEESKELIDNIGNLTLTGFNSTLSNKSFNEKRNAYKESNIQITREIYNWERWSDEEIKERGELLASKAVKIWNLPEELNSIEGDKNAQQGISYLISLKDDDIRVENTKPLRFSLEINNPAMEIKVKSWRELYIEVLKRLMRKYPTELSEMANNEKYKFISQREETFKNSKAKINDIYFNTNLSSETIIKNLQTIFEYLYLDGDDLVIEYK